MSKAAVETKVAAEAPAEAKVKAESAKSKLRPMPSPATFECQSTLSVDSGYGGVLSVSFSPMGDMIAAGCGDGEIHLLDTATVSVKRSLSGHSER